jgi:hypothetical protein
MEQDGLWASSARPKRLTIHLERMWELSDHHIHLVVNSFPSKGSAGLWVSQTIHSGPNVAQVLPAATEAITALWLSTRWDSKPRLSTTAEWEQRLLEY